MADFDCGVVNGPATPAHHLHLGQSEILDYMRFANPEGLAKAGRPTKYEPETVGRLLVALADGLTIKQGCLAAGIGQSTLSDWLERHPELEVQLAEVRESARDRGTSEHELFLLS